MGVGATWLARHPMAGDAGVVALLTIPVMMGGATLDWPGLPGVVRVLWALSMLVALRWRRSHPDVACAVIAAAHLVQLAVTRQPNVMQVTVPVALYAVASYSRQRWYRVWLLVGVLASFAAAFSWAPPTVSGGTMSTLVGFAFTLVACLAVVAASWFLGELSRERRSAVESLRERAASLERERDQLARLAVQEERALIAREMHDVVAHSLSVIVVQADGAAYAVRHHPVRREPADHPAQPSTEPADLAATALETIAETARAALAETRRLVGVLRDERAGAVYAPSETLEQIADLVSRLQEAGVRAGYEQVGDPAGHAPLGAGAELAAYRVVQESLTNVVKHAGRHAHERAGAPAADLAPVSVVVRIEHSPAGITVAVRDDGVGTRGADRPDGGHGLIGMRERVAAYGGTLVARDRLTGGFEVLATLPAGGGR